MLPVEKVVLPDTEITRNIITVEKITDSRGQQVFFAPP